MNKVYGYREVTGFPPSPWWKGEVREVEESNTKYSVILLDIVVESADTDGPNPSYALSLPALYRLISLAHEAGLLETQPFPPAPGAVATRAGWVFQD